MTDSTWRLEQLCDVRSGGTPPRTEAGYYEGSIPWAKIDDLNVESGVVLETKENITTAGLAAIRGKLFEEGTILFAMYGSVGKKAWSGVRLATNQAILGIRVLDESKLDARFLWHWLDSKQTEFERDANGVTQKNLSAGYIRSLEIELPPLEDQQRIATILDKAGSVVCIEQPELHVHPAVQVGLGDLFIDGALNKGLSFLIETHSEHLVMRLQRRLREAASGELPDGMPRAEPSSVSMIYLGRDESGAVCVTPIGLTDQGKFDTAWPDGFFPERTVEVLPAQAREKLETARKERKA